MLKGFEPMAYAFSCKCFSSDFQELKASSGKYKRKPKTNTVLVNI